MQSKDPTKHINLWLYVILSALPIVGYYPVKKLKKMRKMLVINVGVICLAYLTSFIMAKIGYTVLTGATIPIISATPVSIIVQSILVHNWVKEHNQRISEITP